MILKGRIQIFLLYFLFFTSSFLPASNDSLFFSKLKEYYFKECGRRLDEKLFTQRAPHSNIPFQYVFVSARHQVKNVLEGSFIYCDQDTVKAKQKCFENLMKGYSAYVYGSYGTSDTKITDNLLSYPAEARSFLVFHELTHNYIIEGKVKIRYKLNEAACDVIGLKLSEKMLKEGKLDAEKKDLKELKRATEAVYKCILSTRKKIERDSNGCDRICAEAQKKIKEEIRKCGKFYQDRFDYPVNTAFLLKNLNYCTYYFKVKKMWEKSRNFEDFFKALAKYNLKLHES